MGFKSELDDKLCDFIRRQHMFFTATAPTEGRINLSPKGMDTFRILSFKSVAYLDLTGSGNETAAHIAENGRMTIMFCSFGEKPLILRLYGRGRVLHHYQPEFASTLQHFQLLPAARQIIVLDVESLQTSCGFGVPAYEHVSDRDKLVTSVETMSAEAIEDYWRKKNATSIDGLPTNVVAPD